MIRRFGEPKKSGVHYKTRPGAYGILCRGNKALITFQYRPDAEYQLPGGGIEPGESPLMALHREVREETGFGLRVERRLGVFQRYTYMSEYDLWARKICHIYLCGPTRQRWKISEPHHSAVWLSLDEAAHALANSGDRHFVQQFIHSRANAGRCSGKTARWK